MNFCHDYDIVIHKRKIKQKKKALSHGGRMCRKLIIFVQIISTLTIILKLHFIIRVQFQAHTKLQTHKDHRHNWINCFSSYYHWIARLTWSRSAQKIVWCLEWKTMTNPFRTGVITPLRLWMTCNSKMRDSSENNN